MNAEQIRQGQKLPDRDLNPPESGEEEFPRCSKCGEELWDGRADLLCDDCMDEEVSRDQNKKDSVP